MERVNFVDATSPANPMRLFTFVSAPTHERRTSRRRLELRQAAHHHRRARGANTASPHTTPQGRHVLRTFSTFALPHIRAHALHIRTNVHTRSRAHAHTGARMRMRARNRAMPPTCATASEDTHRSTQASEDTQPRIPVPYLPLARACSKSTFARARAHARARTTPHAHARTRPQASARARRLRPRRRAGARGARDVRGSQALGRRIDRPREPARQRAAAAHRSRAQVSAAHHKDCTRGAHAVPGSHTLYLVYTQTYPGYQHRFSRKSSVRVNHRRRHARGARVSAKVNPTFATR
eukprot:1365249-Pleurochrysis_carterae.AAC.3